MPRQVKFDGRIHNFPDDATDEEIRAALSGQAPAPSAGGTLSKVESISSTPWYQRDMLPALAAPFGGRKAVEWLEEKTGFGGISPEEAAEGLPAAAATAATAAATKHPGLSGIVGGVAGEAGRQLLRRAVGAPAATGMMQRSMDLDPNSPEAAAASLGGEALAGGSAELAAKAMRALAGMSGRSAARTRVAALQPATPAAKEDALLFADRMRTEGVMRSPTKIGQYARAQKALEDATTKRKALEASLRGEEVPAIPVLENTLEAIPENLPGGKVPLRGRAERKAAQDVADDVFSSIEGAGGGPNVPFEVAQGEKRRWDKLIRDYYNGGKIEPPSGIQYDKNAGDAWRGAIADAFPEMGEANLREHELIAVTELLNETLKRIAREGSVRSAEEAAALGAGLVGRSSIPVMAIFKAIAGSGPWSFVASNVKDAAANILMKGAGSAQAWVRLADLMNARQSQKDIERRQRAEQALQDQGKGVVGP